jgi:hypothetical protein
MNRSFFGLSFTVLLLALLLNGCTADPKYTRWFETSAAVDSYCGGIVSIPGSDGARERYGMYINNKDNTSMDLFFVDIDSYAPGTIFNPTTPTEDGSFVENYNITKTVTEINQAIEEEEALANLLAEAVGKISNTPVTGCKVVFTDNDFCTVLGDGAFACLGNVACDKGINVHVHYVFKGFDTDDCPNSALLLSYLKMEAVKTEKEDKKNNNPGNNRPYTPPVQNNPGSTQEEETKSGRQVS